MKRIVLFLTAALLLTGCSAPDGSGADSSASQSSSASAPSESSSSGAGSSASDSAASQPETADTLFAEFRENPHVQVLFEQGYVPGNWGLENHSLNGNVLWLDEQRLLFVQSGEYGGDRRPRLVLYDCAAGSASVYQTLALPDATMYGTLSQDEQNVYVWTDYGVCKVGKQDQSVTVTEYGTRAQYNGSIAPGLYAYAAQDEQGRQVVGVQNGFTGERLLLGGTTTEEEEGRQVIRQDAMALDFYHPKVALLPIFTDVTTYVGNEEAVVEKAYRFYTLEGEPAFSLPSTLQDSTHAAAIQYSVNGELICVYDPFAEQLTVRCYSSSDGALTHEYQLENPNGWAKVAAGGERMVCLRKDAQGVATLILLDTEGNRIERTLPELPAAAQVQELTFTPDETAVLMTVTEQERFAVVCVKL